MDLDLGTEERELLQVIRQIADRMGAGQLTRESTAQWWQVLGDGGFLDLDVDDGDTALQAVCIAEALGESVAPVGFGSYLTCRMLMRDIAAAGDASQLAAAAVTAWQQGDPGSFAVGYATGPGQGLAESLGPAPRFAAVHTGAGWLLLDAAGFRLGPPSSWEEAPALSAVSWDETAAYLAEPGKRDWNQLNLVLHAAELVGVVRESVRRTIEYLRAREQFGRPIGSFQALQHRTADMVADLRACEATIEYVGWYWGGAPDASTTAAWVAAAAALVDEASIAAMRECFQFHGGIAMTAELWFHHWFRRASRLAAYQGGPNAQLAVVGAAVKAGVTLEVPLVGAP
ncbi:MAG TPA: acyl-CoA dehydrogenase [Trebonia sp.]|jgi:alkylation response protein AidB-like acyl-CoA dehydrogenase|nr:acyl-CoA dehydrogenase [Trebonia sp.]